jgi:hypothetical protein
MWIFYIRNPAQHVPKVTHRQKPCHLGGQRGSPFERALKFRNNDEVESAKTIMLLQCVAAGDSAGLQTENTAI